MRTWAECLVATARSEVGRGEKGQNAGPDIERYRRHKGPRGAWCAAFASYCLEVSWSMAVDEFADEHQVSAVGDLGLFRTRCPVARSHGARRLWKNVRSVGHEIITLIQPGDLVLWSRWPHTSWIAHIGIVADVGRRSFASIEGNVGPTPAIVGLFEHPFGETTRRRKLIGFSRIPEIPELLIRNGKITRLPSVG